MPRGHCPGASGGIGADSLMLFAVGRSRSAMLCGCFIARDQISRGGSLWRSVRSGGGKVLIAVDQEVHCSAIDFPSV